MWIRWIRIRIRNTVGKPFEVFYKPLTYLKKTLTTFSLLFAGTLGSRHTPDLQIRTVIA